MQTLARKFFASPYLVTIAPAAFLLVLPIAHTTAIRSSAFVLTLLAAVLVWRQARPPAVPLKGPLVLWLAVAAATLPWATDVHFSASEIKSEIGYGIALYLAFFALTRGAEDVRRFVIAIAAAVVLLCVHALWTFARTKSIEGDNLHGGVLYFITFLTTAIPVLLAAAVAPNTSNRARLWAAAIIVLAILTGALGLNRSFIPIIAIVVLLFLALHFARMGVDRRTKRRAVLAVALVVPVAAAAFVWIAQQRVGPQLSAGEIVERTTAKDPRLNIWRYSLDQIAVHPWAGTGFGRMAQAQKFQAGTGDVSGVHPHNIVLSYGVQLGIAGMVVVIVLFGAIAGRLIGLYRDPDPTIRLLGICGLCVITAVLLKSMVDDLFVRHNAWLFWCLLGAALGYSERRRADRGSRDARSSVA